MQDFAAACLVRLTDARRIAEAVRGDAAMHRLAMKTVFVLEDCHEGFVQLQRENALAKSRLPDAPEPEPI